MPNITNFITQTVPDTIQDVGAKMKTVYRPANSVSAVTRLQRCIKTWLHVHRTMIMWGSIAGLVILTTGLTVVYLYATQPKFRNFIQGIRANPLFYAPTPIIATDSIPTMKRVNGAPPIA